MTDTSAASDTASPSDDRPYGPPCPGCGRDRTADDATGVAWSSRHAGGRVEYVCPTCTRADIGLIEVGLAPSDRRSSAA
jgi:hypothetical protein